MTTTDRKVTITEVIVGFTGGSLLRFKGRWGIDPLSVRFPLYASDGSDALLLDVPEDYRDTALIEFIDENGRILHSDPRKFFEDIDEPT